MSKQTHALALVCAAIAAASVPMGARAESMISQTASLKSTTTNFDSSSVPPLVINKFDTENGSLVLDSVSLSFSAGIKNGFSMTFTNPATITESFQSSSGSQTGPAITLFEPDGKTALVTAQAPTLTQTESYGNVAGQVFPQTFSSTLPSTSPFYIQPSSVTATGTQTLTSAADLALFTKAATGPTTISLPLSATAFSTMVSSSGNGEGNVSTTGTASVTVTYNYHNAVPGAQTGNPTPAPEPATMLIWSLGGVALIAARRSRRNRAAA